MIKMYDFLQGAEFVAKIPFAFTFKKYHSLLMEVIR